MILKHWSHWRQWFPAGTKKPCSEHGEASQVSRFSSKWNSRYLTCTQMRPFLLHITSLGPWWTAWSGICQRNRWVCSLLTPEPVYLRENQKSSLTRPGLYRETNGRDNFRQGSAKSTKPCRALKGYPAEIPTDRGPTAQGHTKAVAKISEKCEAFCNSGFKKKNTLARNGVWVWEHSGQIFIREQPRQRQWLHGKTPSGSRNDFLHFPPAPGFPLPPRHPQHSHLRSHFIQW